MGGALRRYLLAKKDLPGKSLIAMAPVNTREDAGERQTSGNTISIISFPLGSDIADPLERMAVQAATAQTKAIQKAIGARDLTDISRFAPPATLALTGRLVVLAGFGGGGPVPLFNCAVSNVPGPTQPLYMMGAKLCYLSAVAPILDGGGLFFAVSSYCGRLFIAPTSSPSIVPDPEFLVECVYKSFAEIKEAVAKGTPSAFRGRPRVRRKSLRRQSLSRCPRPSGRSGARRRRFRIRAARAVEINEISGVAMFAVFRFHALTAVAACCVFLAPPAAVAADGAAAQVTAKRLSAADREPGNWMAHGRTWSDQRFSPLAQVNAANVGKLGLAWSAKLDIDHGTEATPLVVDGVMYTTGARSIVYAFDARNGKLLWKYDPKVPAKVLGNGCCDIVNRGVAAWEGKIYVGSFDGADRARCRDGRKVWEVMTIDPKQPYTITGAPRVAKGKVFIGNGGSELGTRGYLTAYDAKTGKQVWRFYTVPSGAPLAKDDAAMKLAASTWPGNIPWQFGGGGPVWDSMSYDPEFNLLYIGTGNATPWNRYQRNPQGGDNLFVASIVALNADTGRYVWHYQTTPNEGFDSMPRSN